MEYFNSAFTDKKKCKDRSKCKHNGNTKEDNDFLDISDSYLGNFEHIWLRLTCSMIFRTGLCIGISKIVNLKIKWD